MPAKTSFPGQCLGSLTVLSRFGQVMDLNLERDAPFVPHRDAVRGFVFDVATGKLSEVAP
jgi:hypothetical protein